MNRKKIYLVRHGQTDFNLRGVVQGSGIDAPINDTGRAQAKAFFEAYQNIAFDQVYHTALIRTRQSIESFISKGIPTTALPELNEISWGDYEGTPMTPEEGEYYKHMLHQWQMGNLDYAIAGGESPNVVAERMRKGIQKILEGPGETILVCMHGRAMRIFLSLIFNYDLRYMDQFEHSNLCLYLLEQLSDGTFVLRKGNDREHLKAAGY
ncbi:MULTISPECIES: histidine phosphatase family protein [unclassified Algoriphagus]|uniref:histidine phosphatase family protein n=2 Tax=Algoriphagus TaxID=246875 RepID=UPI000C68F74B|nr:MULTISPECIES: histidine phosphatase family protein [unclassified Algoriphagus]MAL12480.1 histidine phosphatase family protein [Algoriphagus sp.]MAN88506.1 histidine phosphatase family protein [Algoriphagus sp.]QYH38078.1 histidine phosphatase family protein [Algoriphagus sp. NBT04N3]HAS59103.1 histidine phosphatase family protein [Algoriphagus sp.]HCH44121.1 histidine phosphatase family protein [Algoriphagus sp.]